MVGLSKFFPGDGRIVDATRGRRLTIWNPKTLLPEKTIDSLPVMVKDVVVNWASRRAMILGLHGHGLMLDMQSEKVLYQFGSNSGDCRFAADLSEDGRLIASADMFGPEVRVWDAKTGKQLHLLGTHDHRCTAARFSPNGERLATTRFNGDVGLWDVRSGERLALMKGHLGIAECVAFSPDGSIVLTGGEDRFIRIWNAKTGELKHSVKGHSGSVLSIAVSSDGRRMVSTALDNVMRVWDTSKWRELVALRRSGDTGAPYKRHMYQEMIELMKRATFSQNMRHIVTDIPEVWTAEELLPDRELFQKRRHAAFLKAYNQ